jgi:hypothetical protein
LLGRVAVDAGYRFVAGFGVGTGGNKGIATCPVFTAQALVSPGPDCLSAIRLSASIDRLCGGVL